MEVAPAKARLSRGSRAAGLPGSRQVANAGAEARRALLGVLEVVVPAAVH